MPKPGSNRSARELTQNHAGQMEMVERAGLEEGFVHPVDAMEPIEQSASMGIIMQLGASLTRVFEFIAAGSETNTMDMRVWVVIKTLRPDLLKDESFRQFAARRGVSFPRLNNLAMEFRALFPGVGFARQPRRQPPAHPPAGSLLKTGGK